MLTLISFVLSLGFLIAVHEYGHYRMAVMCGVKVLHFSIGFGRKLVSWRLNHTGTEFSISWIPLGGYVRMLDERDQVVSNSEKLFAFNNKPLIFRALIVAAGPFSNLLLACLLFAIPLWVGKSEPMALLSAPPLASVVSKIDLSVKDHVKYIYICSDDIKIEIRSFDHLKGMISKAISKKCDVVIDVNNSDGVKIKKIVIPLKTLSNEKFDSNEEIFLRVGIIAPYTEPILRSVAINSVAAQSGLLAGDRVIKINNTLVTDGFNLRESIRQSVTSHGESLPQDWLIDRNGRSLLLRVASQPVFESGRWIGRIGASIGNQPAMTTIKYSAWDGWLAGIEKMIDNTSVIFRLLGNMLVGEASLSNLSGPLAMAEYAGKTASLGWVAYLNYLALISVSLGVFNLLPLPMLDGGHLMYYLWESVSGQPVAEVWMDRFQRGGAALLFGVMAVALFNDLTRLLG